MCFRGSEGSAFRIFGVEALRMGVAVFLGVTVSESEDAGSGRLLCVV